MLSKQLFFTTLTAASMILVSCGEKQEHAGLDYQDTTDSISSEVRADLSIIREGIPSPVIIAKTISKSGYSFNKGVLNSSSKGSNYSGKYSAAANLGIYGADFGYVAGFGQSQDVLDYLAQVAKLAKTVGVESAFNEDFGKEINDNMSKGDSLMDIIENGYSKAERNLRSQDRVNVAAIIIAGGWVEGLFIGANTVTAKPLDLKTTDAYHSVYSQLIAYKFVIDLLSALKKDGDCAKMLEDLKALDPIVEKYKNTPKLSEADVTAIKDAISPLRNKITG